MNIQRGLRIISGPLFRWRFCRLLFLPIKQINV